MFWDAQNLPSPLGQASSRWSNNRIITMLRRKDKGGRPALGIADKRKYRVSVKMNTKEYFTAKSMASQAGMSLAEYVRTCSLSPIITQRLTPEEMGSIRKLCGMANNLNQLAHKANAGGYAKEATECSEMVESIIQIIDSIRNDRKGNDKK